MVIGKKRGVALILYGLLMWFSMTCPLWAAEADVVELINLLKSKNVVTQQEAESLLKEMDKNREKERAEIKKDITESAKKGDFLPSALKGFKFGTTIFAEWNAKDYDNGDSSNEFVVNRAYLTLTKDINSWLSLNVTTDIFQSKDKEDDKGNGWEIRLKNAYANLDLLGTQTKIGLIPTPSDTYDSAIWPYRVQGKHLLDETGTQSSADFGVTNEGSFGGSLDDEDYLKYAGNKYAGKWGGYMAGIYNGSGYADSEENDNKVVSGLVYVRPLPTVPILKGLQIAYTGTYGESNDKFKTGQTDNNPDWVVNVAQASLQHKMFTVMGQYYWGKGAYKSTEEYDREGYLLEGFVRIPKLEKLRLFGKYYHYDPNTDEDDDDYQTFVAGVSYDFSKEFMPYIAYEHREYEVQTAKLVDYDKYQVGFQLKF
ncbi:hypothetical protein SAMN04489760_10839 [Syntrophus gentianae]|uniref:Porin n=1 Tax=Syntrophus gentianae TaxID=43775 RepID=A0A1H7WVP7_9BACT|nr:hypothetical protein [Syntrophus gentianae]SEM25501.1 hypothetical protein SAMN04489760_10839 [Syntrophus gentianae]